MADDQLNRILAALAGTGDDGGFTGRLCQVSADIIGVSGAGIMLMSGDLPGGSLCTTDEVSAMIEDLQYTLGEGPCVDAYQQDQVVLEPDLGDPRIHRWLAFTPKAVAAGARAVFGFPVRMGAARLGALNLYQGRPGALRDDQHAAALVMADMIARWVLDTQAQAPPGALANEIEAGGEFHFVVHNAAGVVSVQAECTIVDALIRLRAFAFSNDRLLRDVAQDVVARKIRFA